MTTPKIFRLDFPIIAKLQQRKIRIPAGDEQAFAVLDPEPTGDIPREDGS